MTKYFISYNYVATSIEKLLELMRPHFNTTVQLQYVEEDGVILQTTTATAPQRIMAQYNVYTVETDIHNPLLFMRLGRRNAEAFTDLDAFLRKYEGAVKNIPNVKEAMQAALEADKRCNFYAEYPCLIEQIQYSGLYCVNN